MVRRGCFTIISLILCSIFLSAQESTNNQQDQFRISYKDVFENMHYNQPYRPQVHYTPITGQIADATGLIVYKGEYHLFYMYDEWSKSRRDNKNWGHTISHDLIFWEQKPQILNTVLDNRPGSGSGIVDWNNTLGLQSGIEKTLAVFYTDYVLGSCIAFSRDAGNTWIRHKNNPVIPMRKGSKDRDPLVFWYKPDQSWRLVQYEEPGFTFYKSSDLLNWKYLSKLDGFYECPDFMQIAVDEDENNKKWVIIGANGEYRTGDFNGVEFTQIKGNTKVDFGNALYATQTFKHSYEGDGPFIQLAFLRIPGQPSHNRTWSQQMCFPCVISLKTINGDIRLCRNPINGIKQLRYDPHFWNNIIVRPGENPLTNIDGDVFELLSEIDLAKSSGFEFNIRGDKLIYNLKDRILTFMGNQASVIPVDNKLTIRLIIDRGSIEVFINKGEVTFSNLFYPDPANLNMELLPTGGSIRVVSMESYRLNSIWLKREQELGYSRASK